LGASVLLWILWSIVFARATRLDAPQDIVSRLCRQLLTGSILSLLIAVPTHIVARHRNYCCAGFGTFVGIVFGLAVLLLAFGPGIFFLYAARWKKLHPDTASGTESAPPAGRRNVFLIIAVILIGSTALVVGALLVSKHRAARVDEGNVIRVCSAGKVGAT